MPARFADLLNDFVRARGLSPDLLAPMSVDNRPQGEEPVSLAGWVQALNNIAEATGTPSVGLEIGALIRPRHLGVAGYLLAHCANVGEMLVRMLHFSQLFLSDTKSELLIEGENCVLGWPAGSVPLTPIWADLRLSAIVTFCRNMTGLTDYPVTLTEYALPAPADIAPYTAFYGGDVHFDCARFSVRVGVEMISTPLVDPDPMLVEALDQKAGRLLQVLSARKDIDEPLYQATMQAINAGSPGADAVAARLNCSRRTLNRRLRKYGRSFQQVLDECRLELARNYLTDPQLSITDISGLLGYTEHSAFTRAFRRWTGTTPAEFRRSLPG